MSNKKNWVNKFEVVGIKAGKIFLPAIGTLDLSNPHLPIEQVEKAYELGCPYLKLKDPKTVPSDKAEAEPEPKDKPKPAQKKQKNDKTS